MRADASAPSIVAGASSTTKVSATSPSTVTGNSSSSEVRDLEDARSMRRQIAGLVDQLAVLRVRLDEVGPWLLVIARSGAGVRRGR
jgi:hypothetical protein